MDKIERFQSIMQAMARTAAHEGSRHEPEPRPFITISRQAGAGGHTIQQRLVERLRQLDPSDPPWTGFDRELVELAVGDDAVFRPLVESLGEQTRSWIGDLFSALSTEARATEYAAYRRTAETIRALAQVGRVVMVGRGGVFITRDMPGGVHIHLVAPFEERVQHMADQRKITTAEAEDEVKRLDQSRETFYHRYWPNAHVGPESHTVTYNTAGAEDDAIVESIIPLVPDLGKHRPLRKTVRVAIGK